MSYRKYFCIHFTLYHCSVTAAANQQFWIELARGFCFMELGKETWGKSGSRVQIQPRCWQPQLFLNLPLFFLKLCSTLLCLQAMLISDVTMWLGLINDYKWWTMQVPRSRACWCLLCMLLKWVGVTEYRQWCAMTCHCFIVIVPFRYNRCKWPQQHRCE